MYEIYTLITKEMMTCFLEENGYRYKRPYFKQNKHDSSVIEEYLVYENDDEKYFLIPALEWDYRTITDTIYWFHVYERCNTLYLPTVMKILKRKINIDLEGKIS